MIKLTDKAKQHISTMLTNHQAKHNIKPYLRISITGGGCAGFQYNFDINSAPIGADDKVFHFNIHQKSFEVVTDKSSLSLINNSEIDFEETLTYSNFVVKNPNAASGCGCGTSFSI